MRVSFKTGQLSEKSDLMYRYKVVASNIYITKSFQVNQTTVL